MSAIQTYQALPTTAPSALEPFRGLTAHTQQIFDAAPLPMLAMQLDNGSLIYTNPAARLALGLPEAGPITVWDLLLEEADRETFRQQLQKRRQGHNDDYELTFCRLDNKRRIAVRIAGIALFDEEGALFASLAIVRPVHVSRATEAILKATQSAKGWREVFSALARQLVKVLPFDEFSVALVNEKSMLSKVILNCDRAIQPVPIPQKWYTLTPGVLDQIRRDPLIVPNIRDYLVEVGLAHLIKLPGGGLTRGLRSFMSVPIVRGDRIRAVICLVSREWAFYDERDATFISELPIAGVGQMALHYLAVDEERFIKRFSRDVWTCETNVKIAERIVRELCSHFDWRHVSLFEVRRKSNQLILRAQATRPGTEAVPSELSRPITLGALGEACSSGGLASYPDLPESGPTRDNVAPLHQWTRSLLSYPVKIRDRVRWILNVEDNSPRAFAKEEIGSLRRLFETASVALNVLADRHVLRAVVEESSQGVIIINEEGIVTGMNPEACHLLGVSARGSVTEEVGTGRPLAEFVPDPYLCQALIGVTGRTAEEKIEVRRTDGRVADVLMSARALENNFGRRAIFIKDLAPMQQLKERESVEAAFLEMAEQVRIPLSLATSLLSRALAKSADGVGSSYLDKALRQLAKLQVTFDRLALWRPDLDADNVRINLHKLAEEALGDLPEPDRSKIRTAIRPDDLSACGDHYQLKNAIQSVLAYLLRFCPEEAGVEMTAEQEGGRVAIRIRGSVPDSSRTHAASASLLETIALGESVVRRIVERMHGSYSRTDEGGRAEFKIVLKVATQGESWLSRC
jgi:PAS domain S-box-containing protein